MSLARLDALFKDVYGRPRVTGSYAKLCELVERERFEKRRGTWTGHGHFERLARRIGLQVDDNAFADNAFVKMTYRSRPFVAMVTRQRTGPELVPAPLPMSEYDVKRTQKGKHGRIP